MLRKILKYLFFITFLFVFINLIYLDWHVFLKTKPIEKKITVVPVEKIITKTPEKNICPASCLDLINTATSSIQIPTPQIVKEIKTIASNPAVKEVVIPLGVGSSTSSEWVDLEGIEAYLDSAVYANYKKITFEASLKIPSGSGEASARLFNVSDKHPVWYSDVIIQGSTPKMLISQPVNIDSGNKLYRVQLKSSMGVLVNLDNARLRIVF